MAAINLTGASPTYDTSTQKFGTAALNGGSASASGIITTATNFTVESWGKLSAAPGAVVVLTGQTSLFWLGVNASGVPTANYGANGSSTSIAGSAVVSFNAWHHFVFQIDASGVGSLYVDGALLATGAANTTGSPTASVFGVRTFGGQSGFTWPGSIDELATFTGARYSSAFTPPTSPYAGTETNLTHLYHLDSTLADSYIVAATALTLSGPTSGSVNSPSTNFTVAANGTLSSNVTVTPSDGGGGGTFSPSTVTLTSAANSSTFTYTAASSGAKSISITNNGGLTNPSAVTYTASAAQSILPTDVGIVYSPCNWDTQTARSLSINPGAYFKTLFSGTSCILNFDVSANTGDFPQIFYRVDRGPWTVATIAATVSVTAAIPSIDSGWARRLLEVVIRTTSIKAPRWGGADAAVRFTGLTLDNGATVAAPSKMALKGIIYGDSITEGCHDRYLNLSASPITEQCDSLNGYALELASLLGCELGVIGFGGQGWGATGVGSVPILPTAYNQIYSGVARTFPSDLNFVLVNMGQNDGSNNATATITAWINAIVPQLPSSCPLIFLRPFSGNQAANIQSAIAASSYASRCSYVDTTGFFTSANSADGVHPYGFENIASLSPKVASAVRTIITPAANSNIYLPQFRAGFH